MEEASSERLLSLFFVRSANLIGVHATCSRSLNNSRISFSTGFMLGLEEVNPVVVEEVVPVEHLVEGDDKLPQIADTPFVDQGSTSPRTARLNSTVVLPLREVWIRRQE